MEKKLRDLQRSSSSPDAHHFLCRACKAEDEARHRGVQFHLGLSLEMSKKMEKVCRRCGEKKEARDFALRRVAKDELARICRACDAERMAHVRSTKERELPPAQVCQVCSEMKPRTDFHKDPASTLGLSYRCIA